MAFSTRGVVFGGVGAVFCGALLSGCVKETLAEVPVIGEPTVSVHLESHRPSADGQGATPTLADGSMASAQELMACAQKELPQVHLSRLVKFPQDANRVPLFGHGGAAPVQLGLCCAGPGSMGFRIVSDAGTVATGGVTCGTTEVVDFPAAEHNNVELIIFPALKKTQWLAYSAYSK